LIEPRERGKWRNTMEFWTTLIKVNGKQSEDAQKSLKINCTHVTDDYYIMEGDVDCLRDDGVSLHEIAEGAVPSLGGLSENELITLCSEVYGVDIV